MKKYLLVVVMLLVPLMANAELPDFSELIEKYSPAVVNISTTKKKTADKQPRFREFGKESPFGEMPDLFRHFFERGFEQKKFDFMPRQELSALGSGMIISQDGYIMTNHHVVSQADEIVVRLKDRREFKAKLVGSDKYADTAIIKIEGQNLPTVKIGTSKNIKVGEWVFAIGSPFGFDLSASAGIISAKGRSMPDGDNYNYVPFIQTDVAINPGNSGGPLFNMKGEVIGVNSMIYSKSGGYMGLSFSIPIDVAINVANQLRKDGSVTRGWLGVLIQPVTYDLAESFGMAKPEGSLVARVMQDSPAEKAGLKVGDVVLKFNGVEISQNSDLPPIVASMAVGSSAPLEIFRDGKKQIINVVVGKLPDDTDKVASAGPGYSSGDTTKVGGMTLGAVSATMREKLKIGKIGIMVTAVSDEGNAAKSGIRPNDIIVKFAYKEIKDANQLKELIKRVPKGKSVPVYVIRASGPAFLAWRNEL